MNILHAADLHLDSPFQSLPQKLAAQRRREQRQLIKRISGYARREKADLVLLPGDLFDSREIYPETALTLRDALADIPAPVFISPGNHDYWGDSSPYRGVSWPENVHIFTSPEMERVELPDCVVYGCAFTGPYRDTSPLAGFQPEEDGGRLRLMVFHGDPVNRGRYASVTKEEIAASGMDYIAFGHIHAYGGICRAGDTCYAWPGCPEGRGFDETGDKYVLWIKAFPGDILLSPVTMEGRRYWELMADITDKPPLQAALDALPQDCQGDILRLTFTGRGENISLAAMEEELAPRCFHLILRDRTTAPVSLWQRQGEDSLPGAFLQELSRRERAGTDPALIQLAARFGLAALEGGERPV